MARIATVLSRLSPRTVAALMGLVAGLAVLATLGDPGVTIDEPLDVRPGRTYVQRLLALRGAFFERANVDAVFRDNAEHPPLGRWLLGIASTCGQPFETLLYGRDPLDLYLLSARVAPALAFAALVALIVQATIRRHGKPSGVGAGIALFLMPRVFGHAHLGALDTFLGLFWTAALLAADRALTSRRPVVGMAAAGLVWSLALLTKIHAWFLIPIVFAWTLVRLGRTKPIRAIGAYGAWWLSGFVGFVVGWPWLWYDGFSRLQGYLGTGVVRSSIRVLYLGEVYADRDVPWHYPWVYFAVTVPIGLHLLGVLGLRVAWKGRKGNAFPLLLVGSILTFLVTFSTRVPVYDGERLFLLTFPLWAIVIGMGIGAIWEGSASRRWRRWVLAGWVACQGYGIVVLHPFELSYYNALVWGLPGAERLGLELTYWNDAVDRVLLDRLAKEMRPGDTVALVPTLYPGQGTRTTNRTLVARETVIADQERSAEVGWLVVSRRTAYWPKGIAERLRARGFVAVRIRQGIWLSGIARVGEENSVENTISPRSSPNVHASP